MFCVEPAAFVIASAQSDWATRVGIIWTAVLSDRQNSTAEKNWRLVVMFPPRVTAPVPSGVRVIPMFASPPVAAIADMVGAAPVAAPTTRRQFTVVEAIRSVSQPISVRFGVTLVSTRSDDWDAVPGT